MTSALVSSDDSEDPGPFGDHWHTKEGVSKGVSAAYSSLCVFAELQRSCCAQNAGGPWDGASGPMNGCMKGLKAKSSLDMIWSASWSAPRYMPTVWAKRFRFAFPSSQSLTELAACACAALG